MSNSNTNNSMAANTAYQAVSMKHSAITKAINHWYSEPVSKVNKQWYYQFIRKSPVVRFKNDAEAINFLKKFRLSNKNSNYYKGNNTFAGHILQRLPKHRNFYVMNIQPFAVPYGNRGLLGIPGMVRVKNQRPTAPRGTLGLVNKALMNRYLTRRSQTLLNTNTKNLKKTRALIRSAETLFGSIEKRRKTVKNAANKWRYQASMQAAKKRFQSRLH
jgi:hypothetical protein